MCVCGVWELLCVVVAFFVVVLVLMVGFVADTTVALRPNFHTQP